MGSKEYLGSGSGGFKLTVLAIVLGSLSFLAVIARLALRNSTRKAAVSVRNSLKWLGWDDFFICIALVLDMSMSVCTILATYHGYGNPSRELSKHDAQYALYYFWVTQTLYKAIMACTKTSMLALYLRVFTNKPVFARICYFMIVVVWIYALISIFFTIFQCIPLRFAWDKSGHTGTCINLTAFWYANASVSIVTDFIIVTMPIWYACKLQMPIRSKILLVGVFLVGGIVILASILRTTTLDAGSKAKDSTKGTFTSTLWTTIEVNVAIIGACLPMLRQALVRCWPKLLGASSHHWSDERDSYPRRNSIHANATNNGFRNVFGLGPSYDIEGQRPMGRHAAVNGSEDAILNGTELYPPPPRAITVKTEIDIGISDAHSDSLSDSTRQHSRGTC